jgi:hypothetical protein
MNASVRPHQMSEQLKNAMIAVARKASIARHFLWALYYWSS